MGIKKFLFETILFFIPVTVLLIIAFFILNYQNKKLLNEYTISSEKNTLVIGDSHTQGTVLDSLLPGVINLSLPSDSYIHIYSKLNGLLKNNKQIKTVILGYGYHNISSFYDEYIFGSEAYFSLSNSFFINSGKENVELLTRNKSLFFTSFANIFKKGVKNVLFQNNEFSFFGKFTREAFEYAKPDTLSVLKRITSQYYSNGQIKEFSVLQLKYLKKIIDLCRQQKVHLVLINTPLFKFYEDNVPAAYKNKYQSFVMADSMDIIYLKSPLLDSSCYIPDGEHLNFKGALIASTVLKNILNKP